MILETILPIKTVSEANMREHWAAKHKRHKQQRYDAFMLCRAAFGHSTFTGTQRVLIELTRLATRKLDRDNLYGSGKSVVDGICDWLGIDDGDKLFTLSYSQDFKSKSNELQLRITIND